MANNKPGHQARKGLAMKTLKALAVSAMFIGAAGWVAALFWRVTTSLLFGPDIGRWEALHTGVVTVWLLVLAVMLLREAFGMFLYTIAVVKLKENYNG